MAFLDDIISVPRRTLTLFFLIDASSGMNGEMVGAVNDAMTNVIPMLDEISQTNPDAEIKVAALEFSDRIRWMYNKPQPVSEFIWQGICASGSSLLGKAFSELNIKLSRKNYMQEPEGAFAPIIVLLSARAPEDNYVTGLLELKANDWFKSAIKIAIAIGNDTNFEVLEEFTGSSKTVFTLQNIETLKHTIRLIALTSSQIGSNSIHLFNSHEELNSCSKMKLREALIQAVSVFGKGVLIESRLLNILNDFHGFDEIPAARLILRIMQEEGYMSQLVSGAESLKKLTISQMPNKINKRFGIESGLVENIINCLLECVGYTVVTSSVETSDEGISSLPTKHISITEVSKEDLKNAWSDKDGVQYSKNRKRLLQAPKSIDACYIQEGTKIICNHAFSDCRSLENLILPEGLTHIGDSAFSACKSLQSLFLPKTLIHIGDNAFSWCLSLRFLVFQNKIKTIGQDAFRRCFLEKVFIPNGTRSHFENILPKEIHKTIIEGNSLTTVLRNQ